MAELPGAFPADADWLPPLFRLCCPVEIVSDSQPTPIPPWYTTTVRFRRRDFPLWG